MYMYCIKELMGNLFALTVVITTAHIQDALLKQVLQALHMSKLVEITQRNLTRR